MHLLNFISGMKRKASEKISKLQFRQPVTDSPENGTASLPVTLNLMVTNRCNSRCVMCNVWKKKREDEFTPDELARILGNPLFDKLTHVGVSGGEPTLRKDLPEIFRVITGKKGLAGVSLITNALQADTVINQVESCYRVSKEANVPFSLMVSLDGIGKIHDTVRGRKGGFENALKVIHHFRHNTEIPLTIGCTVVKENVWHIDEVLDFCIEEKITGRFRVAEFIDRLDNACLTASIRNFDADEKYQVGLFFSKLELRYEKDPNVKATYRNIRRMVFEEMPRESGCPYRSAAVGLDSRGNLIYCSPKSPVLGSCLEESALDLYINNNDIRRNIIAKHCSGCIHDYHAPPPEEYLEEVREETQYNSLMSVKSALKDSRKIPGAKFAELAWENFNAPLIVGWYGTETAGDKAILGNIASRLLAANKNTKITIASIFPFVTKRTLSELGIDAAIVKTYSEKYLHACENADVVIMGGGPLMGMEPLGFVLEAFLTARKFNIPAVVEGCGIGPLSQKAHIAAVKEILRLSTAIRVRDTTSLAWVIGETGRNDAVCTGDPAVGFVEDWKNRNPKHLDASKQNHFACFLRELTFEYANGMKHDEFMAFKKKFEDELGKMVLHFMQNTGLKPLFMPMHTFVIGNDDRDFMRRFVKTYLKDLDCELGDKIYSPDDILGAMNGSRFNICMRFHSVLFADALGVPFMAVDYTGGGKIRNFIRDKNKESLMIDRVDLACGKWKTIADRLCI